MIESEGGTRDVPNQPDRDVPRASACTAARGPGAAPFPKQSGGPSEAKPSEWLAADGSVPADDRVVGADQHPVLQGLDEPRPGSVASNPGPFRCPKLPRTATRELLRKSLPRTRVNKGMRKDRSGTQMVSGIERRQGLGVGMAPGYVGA
jgi:hypothetical protein